MSQVLGKFNKTQESPQGAANGVKDTLSAQTSSQQYAQSEHVEKRSCLIFQEELCSEALRVGQRITFVIYTFFE